jgi:hypothetical protein
MIVRVRLDADNLLMRLPRPKPRPIRLDDAPSCAARRELLLWTSGAACYLSALYMYVRLGA